MKVETAKKIQKRVDLLIVNKKLSELVSQYKEIGARPIENMKTNEIYNSRMELRSISDAIVKNVLEVFSEQEADSE